MSKDYRAKLGLEDSASADDIRKEINNRIRAVQGRQNSTNAEIASEATTKINELKNMRKLLLEVNKPTEDDNQQPTNLVQENEKDIVPKLTASDLAILSSSTKNLISASYSIALVIDTSGSMSGQSLDDAKHAMHCFLDELTGIDNQVALVSFGCRTGVICPLTEDIGEIREGVNGLTAENGTPLLEALHATGNEIFPEVTDESMIVIATDGYPNGSQAEILAYASTLKEHDIRIIVIGIGSGVPEDFLKQLASSPDDYFFAKASVELKMIYKKISDGLMKI